MDRRVSQPGYSADVSGRSEHSLSTTTISTVAVQAGRAKIVLAILKSNDWIRVRIQQMEPDLMEVGSTLDEALALRHEHDDLLNKLNMKQKDVADLLARADDLTTQNRTYQEVYEAMAQSLGEAWKDLNRQLEYRKMLLDQSIAFHQSALKFSEKMELAQNRFSQIGLANDVDTARHFLQQHQELKKSILESSMSTLQEGQLLLERIREMGIHADVQNRHATTAACYGIEHLLELLQDRRRHLEELWLQRKVKLEQCLQLLLLDEEVKKVFDWYDQVGDGYLKHSQLGDNLHAAQMLQEDHVRFEMQARDMQETVLRLIRTADQLVHSDHYNAESVKERLKTVDQKSENFMVALDNRRRNLSLAVTFFLLAKTALTKLDEIERQLTSTDLPRNSSALADLHAYMSGAIVEVTAPALREGRTLLERVGRAGPGAKGVSSTVDELQEWSTRLENMCMARYEAGEQSRAYNEFKDRYNTVHTWLTQIGQVTLNHYNNMGRNLSTARDFQEIHERLVGDIKDKMGDMESLVTMAKQLAKESNPQAESAVELAKQLQDQWNILHALTQKRISVAQTYVTFHKRAQEVAIQMDALEQYLKIEKVDPTQITDSSVQHKERKYSEMDQGVKDVETKGKRFITDVKQVEDTLLDTRHAVSVVETIISQFSERKYLITEYHEHWKVHISTGKEFLAQWHQFVQDARKTIDWMMEMEKDPFLPYIAGDLGTTTDDVEKLQKKMAEFVPTAKKAQLEIETHLKMAELLSLKGDTKGEKEQIVNELLKVHTRFQARITEYQLLLNMTIKFFEHLKQLDKLIENTEQEYAGTELPSEVTHAQVMLREHEANHERINQLIGLSHNEGEQIVVRVRQKDSETHAKDGVQNVLEMTDVRRMTWERAWETQKNRLEQNVQVCQFYFDLRQIHGELDELQRQLDARQGHYGHSLSSITMTSEAFKNFEATVEVIEGKIKNFVSTAEMMVRDHTHDSQRIHQEVDEVERKWSRFYTSIHDYRAALDSSTKFFVMMDKCDASVTEAGQFLLQIGQKATDCKTSEDTTNLIQSLELYRTQFAREQDEKLSEMSRIAISIFGPQQGPQRLQHTVDSNTDVISSINRAIEEVAILKANLIKKEQILDEMNKVAETAKTRFIQPLENAEINEGQKFTFQCRLPSDTPEPKIEWFKDNMPLTSPDYQTSYTDGTCTLTIEETFSEDTAKYTCKATTDASTIESSANLTVRELAHQKVVPPDFSKHLKSQDIPEGSQLTLECHTTGIPCPSISWLKDDTNIDNSPDYVITKINGTCCLKVRKVLPEHAGRYTCKATNPGGEASSSARLNVISVKKPYFHEPLKNMTVKESESVKLECHFSAEPAPQIQWLKNDTPIQSSPAFRIIIESTFTSLTIREVYAANAGTYSVVARNLGGEARTSCTLDTTSSIAAQRAPPAMQPRIMQPLQNKDAMEGSSARLDCVIVGQPEPEVIWFHNEQPVKESEDFQLLFEGDRCSLVIREVYLEDSGEYKCVARNKHGVNESKCRLMVEPLSELSDASASGLAADSVAPKFTQLLKDIETPEGSRVRFDCRVIGHPIPNVKWYRGPNEITNSTDFQMTSERELHSLAVPEAFCEDSGNYMVKATNLAGQAKCYAALVVKPLVETTETKMKLVETTQRTVTEQKTVVAGQPPEFKKLFKDMKVRPGDRCQFEVVISGNPRPKVTWLFNAEPVVSPDYQIKSVGDTSILCIPEVFDEDAGRFSVTAENSSGKATCSALLMVEEDTSAVDSAPELLPKHVAPPVAYKPQVYKPEVVKAVAVAPVATTLAPAQVQPPAPSPTYQTQLKQPVTPQFQPVDVTIQLPVPPKFIEKLKNIAAQEGTRVTFQGCVKGKPQPTIRWYKEGKELTDSADFEISYQNGRVSMTIPEVFGEDAGKYACAAENSAGAATSTAELIVKASVNVPEFIDRLQSLEVKEGDPIKFTIRVTGNARVTWYREGSQIVSSPDFEISQQGDYHSLYIPEVFYEDSGKFSVKAENTAGQTMCTAELIVEAPSAIDESASPSPMSRSPSIGARSPIMPQGSSREATPQQPQKPQFTKPLQNRAVHEGDRVVLECVVPPYPAPESVQWACNDVPINDSPDYSVAYNNGRCTLTIVEVFPEDSGTFSCTIIVNGVNNVTMMYLRVEAMPPVSPRPADSSPIFDLKMANQPLSHGQTAYFECKVRAYPPPEILWTRRGHPLVDKARYKSTYDQYSGVTTLTILSLRDEDEGEYTCTAINPLGETSTSATLMAPDRYQAWLRGNQPVALVPAPAPALAPAPPVVPQKSVMTAELQQLQQSPTSAGRATFYRPMSERLLDKTTERRLSDLEVDKPREPFKVSAFEKRLVKEIELREGKYQPPMPASDTEAFEESVPLMQCKPPKFEQKLSNFQLMEGSDATFVCKVSGNPKPKVEWYHEGRLIRKSNRYETKVTRDGYASLRIRVAFPEDAGHYTCCATNLVGRDACSAELFVEEVGTIDDTSYVAPNTLRKMMRSPSGSRRGSRDFGGVSEKHFRPKFRKIPVDRDAQEGQMTRFDCVVSGRPIPELLWFRDGIQVHDDQLHKIVVNEDGIHSLIIHAVQPYDTGHYTAIARNKAGEDTCQVSLNVQRRNTMCAPRFIQRLKNTTVREHETVQLEADCEGVPVPMMSWQKDSRMIPVNDEHYRIETNEGRSTLYINDASPFDSAWYQCTAASRAGTATNRMRLIVQAEPQPPTPERKLVIPKKKTPTPPTTPHTPVAPTAPIYEPVFSPETKKEVERTKEAPPIPTRPEPTPMRVSTPIELSKPAQPRAPSIPSTAEILLSPVPQPAGAAAVPWRHVAPPQAREPQGAGQAPQPPWKPPQATQAKLDLAKPRPPVMKKPTVCLAAPTSMSKPATDTIDYEARVKSQPPIQRPPMQELIETGIEPEPDAGDMFIKETPRPPKFKTQIRPQTRLVESQPAHFECKLTPIGDPNMKVEWYKNGELLRAGHRFKTIYDFGFAALDILYTYHEDNGVYMCKATNNHGSDSTEAPLSCRAKESVITDSQLPPGSGSVQQIEAMEEAVIRGADQAPRLEELEEPCPPVFDLMPEPIQVEEGEPAKFMVKVNGHPRPRLTWWVNGAMVVNGPRFILTFDGMIHTMEIPKVREYDSGNIRVVCKNPMGEAECSTTLLVIPQEDWRSRLKQAPKPAVEVELERHRHVSLQSLELQRAFMKPKTTVVEIRAMERAAQQKALSYKDDEVTNATHMINLQHTQMSQVDASRELRKHDPTVRTETDQHKERARAMLRMEASETHVTHVQRTKQKCAEPPTFVEPLKNVTVKEGFAVKLEVKYTGTPTPVIQWFREGVEIQPSRDFQISIFMNKSYLFIPEVFPEDAGTFSVQAINEFGLVECRAVLIVEEDKVKELKEMHPEFRVQMHDIRIKLGEPATFDCQVCGHPKAEMYWLKNGKRMPESSRWKFIVEEDHYTLLIYETSVEDEGLYECVAVNKMGKATCCARLVVQGKPTKGLPQQQIVGAFMAPQLVEPLRDQEVREGVPAVFECKISATPDPVVQWYYNNQMVKPSKYFQMQSNRGVHRLTITGAFPEDEGTYKCIARNQSGEVTCIAHLTVIPLVSRPQVLPQPLKVMEPPSFSQPITGIDVAEGNPTQFEAIVAGQPLPQVSWFREGVQIPHSDEFQIILEGNRCILRIKSVFPEDAGIFTCRATNPAGVAESSAELFVEMKQRVSKGSIELAQQPQIMKKAPQVLKAPSPIREVVTGSTTKLVVQLEAYPLPRFNWYRNGRQINPSQRIKISYENGVITLVIFNVQPADSGKYELRATNDMGEIVCTTTLDIKPKQKVMELPSTTHEVTLTSQKPMTQEKPEVTPVFVQPLKPEVRIRENTTARLECQVQAFPVPTISWHINGIEIKPSPKYTVRMERNKSVLLINNVQVADSGVYTCRAVSEVGEAISSTTLYVTVVEHEMEPPKFKQPLEPVTAIDGTEVTLSCNVRGRPVPDVSWFHNNKNIDDSDDFVITYNRSSGQTDLVIVDCLPDDQGIFKCVAKNNAGQAVTQCRLTVTSATKVSEVKGEITVTDVSMSEAEVTIVKRVVKRQSGQPPRFTTPIQPQVVRDNETVRFNAVVMGAPVPDITWLKDKVELKPSDHHQMIFDKDTLSCSLIITNASTVDVGIYSCRANNPAGKATCTANVVVVPPDAEVTITEKTVSVKKEKITVIGQQETHVVENSPTFSQPLLPHTEVTEGENVTLQCQAVAEPEPTFTWYRSGMDITPTKRTHVISDKGTSTLTIENVTLEDAGQYVCTSRNALGESHTKTMLHIKRVTRDQQEETVDVVLEPVDSSARPMQSTPTQQALPSEEPQRQQQPPSQPPMQTTSRLTHEQTFLRQQEMYYAAPPLEEPPQFMMPLRDQSVSDGDEVVFRVLFRGSPAPTITWFFNSQPIKNSADFQLMIDAEKGESKLVIVEVFPDDEGEYMCRAENSMGTAVTHCHLFVKLPSSSEEDEAEKIVTKTTEVVKAQEPLTIREMRRFSETIEIEPKEKQQPMELQFGIPKRPSLTSELTVTQPSVPWGMRMHVEVPAPMYSERRSLQLKQRAEALATQRQELQMAITKQRRFSETIAIDLAKKPREVQLQFKLPERSAVTVHRRSAPRGVKMEVDVPRQRTSSIDRPQRAQAIETQRHEVTMSLEGGAPKFVVELLPKKVMDGEEVKLNGRVVGNPMPEVTWYHNSKAILDNPDFRMTYDQRTGEVELHIMEVFPQDTGTYECVASNKYGQAVVKTTVIVEVYEYVPDSEEATASQTESMISTSSMDEAEFQQKTQRFLANMEILRKEIHEDVIPVREFKEETIDELEIEERGYEETIQMADVKWQIQKHSDEVEERVSEETHEPVPDVTTEQLLEGSIPSETVLAAVDIAESHVQPQEAKADEELTTEFVAEGTDVTQHKEIEVELAHHVVQLQPETRVETMKEDRAAEYAENITAEASETTKEEETSVEFVQYSVSDKQETMTQPQVDTTSEEVTLVMEATSEEMTTEQQIIIDLSQPMVEEKVESQVDVVKEDLPDEAVIEITLSEGKNLQEEEITVDLTQPSVEGKRESMVGLQEEMMPVESLSEITLPAQDVPSEEAIMYDMAQPSVQQRRESRVDVLEEKLPEEVLADVAAPSEDVAAEEEITVEVSSHTVELPQETRVDKVEESLPVEGSEELPVPSEEITKEEETTVEMAQPSLDERRESRVDITSQASVDETASDITETSQQTVMEQDIVMTLSESQLIPQDESRTDYVEEKQEIEEEETFVDVPEAMSEGEEIFVELAAIDDKEQQESMVQPSEEVLPEEGSVDISQPSEEMTKEEETIVELAVPSVQPQEESRVEIVVEAPLEERSADITLPSEEIAAEEEIKVDISQPHVEGKVESRTEVVEDITVEESSMEITLTSEETTKEIDITVEMAQPSQEPKQETMVETMEEIIAEEGTAEISLTTEETVSEEEVTLDLAKSSVEGKPETQVTIVEEMQPEELATEVLPTVEDQPSEKAVSVELAQPLVEDKPETQVTTVEEMQQEELATELMPTVEDKPSEEAVTVELAQPLVEDKPETQVTIVEEMQTEELATEVLPTVEDKPSEEAVSVKMAQPSVEDKQESMVVPVDEHQAIESAADIDVTAEETTKQEDTEVDLAQSTVEAPLESRTDIQDETLAEEVLGEVTLPAEEGTQEEETSVELSQLSEMDIKESHVDVQVESIAAEAADEIVVEVTTEMAQSQEVSVDMEQTEVKQTAESMVEIQMSTETAETMIELGEQIPSSETAGSAEIIVDLSVSSIEIEQSHVDFTDERHSEEREEDIFEDVPEALPESKEIVTDLTAIEGRLQPEVLVETQETRTDLELTQDIQIETTEHVSDEEIFYELEQAEEEVPRPSQVDIQEAVADVQSAEKLVTEGEDVSEESKVEVSLEVAEMEPAKPSLTQTQQTELEIQLTGDDVDSYMEEHTVSEDISIKMSSVEMTKKTEMYTEQVKVGEKTEEISDLVSHEVLPAQPELAAEVELMAADMAQQIVQALQEETEQTMLSTEVITEDISQQIATTEVTEQTEQLTEQVTATTMMAPAFNIPLSDVTVIDGEKALLECHVSGIPRPEVTWSVDGQDIKPSADFIITYEASVCVLQILDVLPEDEGEYSVTAINEAGTCSSTAYLTVLPPSGPESEADSVEREKRTMAETMAELETVSMEEMTSTSTQLDVTLESTSESFVTEVKVPEAPRFTRKLENKEIFETLPIQLECAVIGHPEPEVTWYQDGKKMTSTDHALIAYTDGLCSLSIDKVTLEDEAEYMCEARNEAGVATTWAELLVEKLISAVEQVILEEYYEIEIEMHFKWNLPPDLPELPVSEPDQDSIDTDAA